MITLRYEISRKQYFHYWIYKRYHNRKRPTRSLTIVWCVQSHVCYETRGYINGIRIYATCRLRLACPDSLRLSSVVFFFFIKKAKKYDLIYNIQLMVEVHGNIFSGVARNFLWRTERQRTHITHVDDKTFVQKYQKAYWFKVRYQIV